MKRAYKRGGYRDGQAHFLKFFNRVRLDGPLPVKNDNMAAMTLAVGVAYREIYSWKTAILYRHFVCQGTPSFVEDWILYYFYILIVATLALAIFFS